MAWAYMVPNPFRSSRFVRYVSFVTFSSLRFVHHVSFITFHSLRFVLAALFAPCPLNDCILSGNR